MAFTVLSFYQILYNLLVNLKDLDEEIKKAASPKKAKIYLRFFKTGKGEYGEGDHFLGLTVPQCRKIAKRYFDLSLEEIGNLLKNKYHEYRWVANTILCRGYQKGDLDKKRDIVGFYLKNLHFFNNWDLVDGTAPIILGDWLFDKDKEILYKLAKSKNLWERRIAIMSTLGFIKKNYFEDTLKIAEILLNDEHDLIHKAVGWMLREVGKRDLMAEKRFLDKYYRIMPRVMLRYSIEKFSRDDKRFYLDSSKRLSYNIRHKIYFMDFLC